MPLSFAFKRQCHLSEQSSLIAARSQVGLLSSVETCHPRKRKRVGGSKLPSTRISARPVGLEPTFDFRLGLGSRCLSSRLRARIFQTVAVAGLEPASYRL